MKKSSVAGRRKTLKYIRSIVLSKNGEDNEMRCKINKEELAARRKKYVIDLDHIDNKEIKPWSNKKEMKRYKKRKREALNVGREVEITKNI